jgi:hypothetical protein
MKKEIRFISDIVDGDDMRDLVTIFPELTNDFGKSNHSDEYYFSGRVIDLNIEQLEKMGKVFTFNVSNHSITINN